MRAVKKEERAEQQKEEMGVEENEEGEDEVEERGKQRVVESTVLGLETLSCVLILHLENRHHIVVSMSNGKHTQQHSTVVYMCTRTHNAVDISI